MPPSLSDTAATPAVPATPATATATAADAPDPELARYLAAHPAPAASADALIRDAEGRVLLVDPVYKDGWDFPGGLLEDEEPAPALVREVREELGVALEVGRLLVVDTLPADRFGRTVLSFLYAGHLSEGLTADQLTLQQEELREARFCTEAEALTLLTPPLARRLTAALAAERGSHTAVLRDGHLPRPRKRDHYALLPAPMTAVALLVTDTSGRVLLTTAGSGGTGEQLPGGLVGPHESPAQAGARELRAQTGLTVPVGRLLAVDTAPTAAEHGRSLIRLVFAAAPVPAAEAAGLEAAPVAARWLLPADAEAVLSGPARAQLRAALDALADGGIVHLERGERTA